jgi:hypothetical protein
VCVCECVCDCVCDSVCVSVCESVCDSVCSTEYTRIALQAVVFWYAEEEEPLRLCC